MPVRSSRDFQIADLRPGDLLELRDGTIGELREIDPRRGGALVVDPRPFDVDRTPGEDCRRISQASAAGGGVVKRVGRIGKPAPPVAER